MYDSNTATTIIIIYWDKVGIW